MTLGSGTEFASMRKTMGFLLRTAGLAVATSFKRSSNKRIAGEIFRKWSASQGSLFDLMSDDAVIVIPGTAPHCGTFSKADFVRDVATPFMARFRTPPTPRARKIWSDGDEVAVLADATGITHDGKPYANSYVFILRMRGGRIVRATEFLDMAAFNAVWDNVEPLATEPSNRS